MGALVLGVSRGQLIRIGPIEVRVFSEKHHGLESIDKGDIKIAIDAPASFSITREFKPKEEEK